MRLKDKVAIVVGAGQTQGETMGNGRATAIRYAQEGARVLAVDKRADSAKETVRMITEEGGDAAAFCADATNEDDCRKIVEICLDRYGRIDILHNNVGLSEGDAKATALSEENWQLLMNINLKSAFLTIKHVLPVMQRQKSGVITNISSTASVCTGRTLTYKTAKAGINAMTQDLAIEVAADGIRVNAILPGLIDTPIAIERRAREQKVSRESIRRKRDERVPLRKKMGTAWDIAAAAVFLASDEAKFITGVLLPVDGGMSARVG
jgi:NAD(P)-dependent dehydrogenase (short-subunit alcohol dehydrogenase family)